MRIKEQWKQPVSRADAWKSILVAVLLVSGIGAFGQIIFNTRFERISWAVLLLLIWVLAAAQITKTGWRAWQPFQTLWLIGYTFFATGNIIPHGAAASWLANIDAALLIVVGILTFANFRKTKQPISTNTAPPAVQEDATG